MTSQGLDTMTKTPEAGPGEASSKSGGIGRFLPLVAIVGLMGFAFAMGWHRYLSFQVLAENLDQLNSYIGANLILAVFAYMALYVAVVTLSLPGAGVLSITGGLLFGWYISAPATVLAATLGATLLFLIVKTSLGAVLADKAGPWLAKLKDGFAENGLSYLLFLRLVPAFPFFIVNIAPALLGVRLSTFVFGTFFGIIPGSIAFAFLGSGLGTTLRTANEDYQACVAQSGADACSFALGVGDIVNKEILIAFAALGVVALIPIVLKRFRGSSAGNDAA